jgi:hypothetical protein
MACLAGAGLLSVWTPSDDGRTVCPFALVTGVACPGCGMTRALAVLLHGRLGSAVRYHPLAPLLAIGLGTGLVWWWGRDHLGWPAWSARWLNGVVIAFLVALLAAWAVRFATGTLPPV